MQADGVPLEHILIYLPVLDRLRKQRTHLPWADLVVEVDTLRGEEIRADFEAMGLPAGLRQQVLSSRGDGSL